jgi:uncharacterized protein with HEPN domain
MSRDYRLYLEDILEAIEKIEAYTKNTSFESLENNKMLLDAVLYNLEIIGEATKHLPEDLKENSKMIEWRRITGLRDIIAHQYFGVSLEIIWDVVQNKLPELKLEINRLLKSE